MRPGMRDDAVIEFLPNHVSIFQFLGKMFSRYFWFANMAKKKSQNTNYRLKQKLRYMTLY